ncbi:hypothetical protein [Streptosporangium amethystogenes]|uniref:hypothetical protein n=1 Tax=Streptosporangium amethystogenes TaxID=2002 RepID=UPI0012F77C0E|nr:hypothetical protein [Streptosporangium amethystogenes]
MNGDETLAADMARGPLGGFDEAGNTDQDACFRPAGEDRSEIGDVTGRLVARLAGPAPDVPRSARVRREKHVVPWRPEVSAARVVTISATSVQPRVVVTMRMSSESLRSQTG